LLVFLNNKPAPRTLRASGAALMWRARDRCKYVGQTALHFASRWGHGGTVAVLLERGASAGEKDAFGKTPLEMAKAGGHGHVYSALGG